MFHGSKLIGRCSDQSATLKRSMGEERAYFVQIYNYIPQLSLEPAGLWREQQLPADCCTWAEVVSTFSCTWTGLKARWAAFETSRSP